MHERGDANYQSVNGTIEDKERQRQTDSQTVRQTERKRHIDR